MQKNHALTVKLYRSAICSTLHDAGAPHVSRAPVLHKFSHFNNPHVACKTKLCLVKCHKCCAACAALELTLMTADAPTTSITPQTETTEDHALEAPQHNHALSRARCILGSMRPTIIALLWNKPRTMCAASGKLPSLPATRQHAFRCAVPVEHPNPGMR